MIAVRTMMRKLRADERGATAIEYGLIVSMITLAVIGGVTSLGEANGKVWAKVVTEYDKT